MSKTTDEQEERDLYIEKLTEAVDAGCCTKLPHPTDLEQMSNDELLLALLDAAGELGQEFRNDDDFWVTLREWERTPPH